MLGPDLKYLMFVRKTKETVKLIRFKAKLYSLKEDSICIFQCLQTISNFHVIRNLVWCLIRINRSAIGLHCMFQFQFCKFLCKPVIQNRSVVGKTRQISPQLKVHILTAGTNMSVFGRSASALVPSRWCVALLNIKCVLYIAHMVH